MRTSLLIGLLVLPLTACSLHNAAIVEDDLDAPVYQDPLQAWIVPDYFAGQPAYTFYVNRPAYVAVFEIEPGRGTGLVYPTYNWHSAYVDQGLHRFRELLGMHRWAYHSVSTTAGPPPPRYILLVASDQPLRLSQFKGSTYALRRSLGFATFTANNPYYTMDVLTSSVRPESEWADYTTDVYVLWPQPRSRPLGQGLQFVVVECPDGQRYPVPLEYARAGLMDIACSPVESTPTSDDEGDDGQPDEKIADLEDRLPDVPEGKKLRPDRARNAGDIEVVRPGELLRVGVPDAGVQVYEAPEDDRDEARQPIRTRKPRFRPDPTPRGINVKRAQPRPMPKVRRNRTPKTPKVSRPKAPRIPKAPQPTPTKKTGNSKKGGS